MSQEIIISLRLIIGLAAILTIVARIIKQPPIIAYLIAGILAGPLMFGILHSDVASSQIIQTFAHIGVAFLLFIVGLSLDLKVLKELGSISALAGIGGIIITGCIGFLIAIGLGFQNLSALYLAIALAFSSTVLVIKIFSDKNEMDTLHARISLGILIVQDFVAALALMIMPVIRQGSFNTIIFQISKILGLVIVIFAFSALFVKKFLHYLASNQEVLFLSGVAWALIISNLFHYLGLSIEIGALIAGMSLASSRYTLELGGKIKPLRDFFIIMFFVFFGSQLAAPITKTLLIQAGIFSLFVLLGKPIITMTLMKFLGYKKRTNFLTGASLAQISEFSLILVLVGFTLGHLPQEIMSLTVLIAITTIAISSYNIYYSNSIFNKISRVLFMFESKKIREEKKPEQVYDIILFGYNRTGYSLLKTLIRQNHKFIVVDYDPRIIMHLSQQGINCVYGDASDKEFVEEIKLTEAKMVISTIPDIQSNLTIRDRLKEVHSKAIFIATAEQIQEALDLYKEGADYVIVPHILGGDYASKLVEKFKTTPIKYKILKREHIKDLEKRQKEHD